MKTLLIAVVALAASVRVASAQGFDVHGYVEPCTLANVEETHLECAACTASTAAPNACLGEYAPRGFEKRCRAQGGHEWVEIWCRDLRLKNPAKMYEIAVWAVLVVAAGAGAFVYLRRARKERD